MTRLFLLLVALFVPLFSSMANTVIKCEAGDGSVYFIDTQCQTSDRQIKLNLRTGRPISEVFAVKPVKQQAQAVPVKQYDEYGMMPPPLFKQRYLEKPK